MGKKSGYSWLDAVKKAFRSPTKDHQEKRTTRRREPEEEEEDEEEEKRGRKRWTFRRHFSLETTIHAKCSNSSAVRICSGEEAFPRKQTKIENNPPSQQRRDFATTPHDQAALLIQKLFRGYLARRALLALRGVVKLQALIRGHNVRKRAKMTLQCIQSLVRVQALVCDQRRRLSCEATTLGSSSLSVDSSELEEIRSLIHKAKECSIKQSNTLAQPFSQQIWMKHHRRRRSSHEQFLDSVSASTPRKNPTLSLQSPKTPSSSKSICYQTPKKPTYIHRMSMSEKSCPIPQPNYMAATASAMARVRPSSTPRQRLSSPGRELTAEYSAKKRLSFTMQDGLNAADGLKFERYRGVRGGRVGDERRSDKPYYGTD